MIHDELLAFINSPTCRNSRTLETPYAALRAVVELHKPVEIDRELNYNCQECEWGYPCLTIQAIEKELS
jgi:hypothetical protein